MGYQTMRIYENPEPEIVSSNRRSGKFGSSSVTIYRDGNRICWGPGWVFGRIEIHRMEKVSKPRPTDPDESIRLRFGPDEWVVVEMIDTRSETSPAWVRERYGDLAPTE